MAKHNKRTPPAKGPGLGWIAGAAGLFLVICLNNEESVKGLTMLLMAATLIFGFFRFGSLQKQITLPLVLLMAITAMGLISTAYAPSGKFALRGVLFLMCALCPCLIFSMCKEKSPITGRFPAITLAAAASLISLLSIDHISTRLLSGPVLAALGQFTGVFDGISGLEEQVRLTSIFDAPNVFAGCAGIGVLLSLTLATSATGKAERRLHLAMLYTNALAFVLAFSLGATFSLGLGFLFYLLLTKKDDRRALTMLLVQTLAAVLLAVIPISIFAFGGWNGIQPIPMLCLLLGGGILCLADHFLTPRLTELLRVSGKKLLIITAVCILAAAGFAAAACLWTGSSCLSAGDSLRRAVYPEAGNYEVAAEHQGSVSVTIESQNRQQAMMHTSTILFSGDLEDAAFTVPEDSLVVYFNFTAQSDATVAAVSYTGTAGSGSVPLDYKLLPGFISNRIQGLFANQNFIQRGVFFKDGLKVFAQSPLVGRGMGAFEVSLFSVQDFHYETKYVHNHYIQTLLETGIVGLLLFTALLAASGWMILKARKQKNAHPFLPALGALMVFMAIHAGVEVVFSSGFYLPLAFGVFTLTGLCCGNALKLPQPVRTGALAAGGILLLTFSILLSCNLRAASLGQNAQSMDDFHRAARLDPFEWSDYAISYVANAPEQQAPEVLAQAEEYAARLDKLQSTTIHFRLAQYYFQLGQPQKAMEMAEKQARATISSSSWWNTLLELVQSYDDGSEGYRTQVHQLLQLLDQWEQEHMGEILLEEHIQSYVNQVAAS